MLFKKDYFDFYKNFCHAPLKKFLFFSRNTSEETLVVIQQLKSSSIRTGLQSGPIKPGTRDSLQQKDY